MNVTVIFDGKCGVCTRTVRKLSDWDKRNVLEFRTCQSVNLDGVEGVTPTKCMRAVWAVSEDGKVASGSDAAALIASAMLNNWWPWRIARLPIIQQILGFGYQLVADNRMKFPGDTPWCQQHPDDCNYRQPVERISI